MHNSVHITLIGDQENTYDNSVQITLIGDFDSIVQLYPTFHDTSNRTHRLTVRPGAPITRTSLITLRVHTFKKQFKRKVTLFCFKEWANCFAVSTDRAYGPYY